MNSTNKKRTLGRGLDALISNDFFGVETQGSSSINEIAVADITPNTEQPRSDFDSESLEELAASIRHIGIVQPITVYELPETPGKYKIISGERRFRASKLAGLETIPAYVRTVEDEQIMEMALVENIQREDLNAIEISLAFKKLMDDYNLTQEELSSRVGKKRATISNYLRLLRLPAEIQMALKNGKISMGHARSLLSVDDPELQLAFYEQVLNEGLSVRQVEEMVKVYLASAESTNAPAPTTKAEKKPKSATMNAEDFKLLSERFSQLFQTKVSMNCNKDGKGKITIPFASDEQLEGILSLLDKL